MSRTRLSRAGIIAVSLLGLVLFWAALAWARGDPRVLPGPVEVADVVAREWASGKLTFHLSATLLRVAGAFALAMAIGTVIGIAMGRSAALNRWFGAWLIVLLNIPALVVIVLCYLWIGLNETAAIVAVTLNKTAMVAVTIREGMHALDPKLADMAGAFRMTPLSRLRHIVLPQLWPFIAASTRNGLAIIWKIVLVVEFLGRSNGVGFQIHLYFQLFDISTVLAYSMSFVVIMLVIEYGLVAPMEDRAVRWRRSVGPATPVEPRA